jgi:hypothetical protein
VIAVEVGPKPLLNPGAGFVWRADARIRVQGYHKIYYRVRIRKNHDKFIDATVRVMASVLFAIVID